MKRRLLRQQTQSKWTAADIPDQDGRTIVVTGANSGIGAAAALELGRAGARLILAVRDTEKGAQVAETLPGATEIRRLDVSQLESVREFADSFDGNIDVLINNAGVMGVPYSTTADGFETQLATNYLGPFALTGLLLGRLRDRVITVSSQAHRHARLRLDDLSSDPAKYDSSAAYNQSKLATLLFHYELHRRLVGVGSPIRAIAAHPGLARSNLLSNAEATRRMRITGFAQRRLGQPTDRGALPLLFAATVDLPNSTYVGPDGFYELRGHPKIVDSSRASKDPRLGAALWELSEQLTGVRYDFGLKAPPDS
jgi:NAD(P)-dependent dehydrogenase (short-subunit alcohol dehydrogenase family)